MYCAVSWCATHNMGRKEWRRYLRSKNGRREFQIDLAISLINYAMTLDWEEGGERPKYVRQTPFIPCDCKLCFFCLGGHTGVVRGIYTKKRKSVFHYQCGGRLVSEGCTLELVLLNVGCQNCRMCYRTQDPSIPSRERDRLCNKSTMGCAQCKVPICKRCWSKGYNKHQKKKRIISLNMNFVRHSIVCRESSRIC